MASNDNSQAQVSIFLSTLKDIAEAVVHAAEAGTLTQVLQQIAYVAQQLIHSRYAALGIPSEQGTLKFFEVVGIDQDDIRQIGHPPIGRGLLGVIMHEREILRLEHMRDDPRSVGFPAHHPPMESLLGVPVQTGQHLFGMLYLTDREDGQPFTLQDQWLVESLAGYAALAITGTQLSEQHGRLTLLEERERVGMELHDGIIQSLYAIGMQLQLIGLSQPTLGGDIREATQNLDAVIEDIRRYIMNLKVANYEQQTLREALLDVIARLHVPESIIIEVDAPDRQPPFAPPVVEAVCQIAYEAVSNVIRHSQATEAVLEVTQSPTQFQMVIRDNGKGFKTGSKSDEGGLGLRNIMHRARIFGGDVKVDTAPGRGTRLTLILPV